jgi:hypothetical protein
VKGDWWGLRADSLCFCPELTRPPLPRSGYTKQPSALALGQRLVKGALKVAPDVGRVGGIIREEPKEPLRPPLVRRFVLILKYRPIVGEGSRPRPAAAGLLSKPSTFDNCRRKYTVGFRYVLAARGDARPPRIAFAATDWRCFQSGSRLRLTQG